MCHDMSHIPDSLYTIYRGSTEFENFHDCLEQVIKWANVGINTFQPDIQLTFQLPLNPLFLLQAKHANMNVNRKIQTLDEFTIQQLRDFPQATGELSHLLRNIGLAAKRVNTEVNKAGLVDILGDTGTTNVQGEEVKKLDVYANDQFTGFCATA